MNKLTVLIDMDDVLENLCEVWVDILNNRFGMHVRHEDVRDWDISKAFPTLTHDEVYIPLSEFMTWSQLTPLPGAREYVKKLQDDGHDVVVVTASHPSNTRYKYIWLQRYFPQFKYRDVIFTSRKQMICGDVLIDDKPQNLENAAYAGILMSQPHNLSYDIRSEWIRRANSWEDAYNLVRQLSEHGSWLHATE